MHLKWYYEVIQIPFNLGEIIHVGLDLKYSYFSYTKETIVGNEKWQICNNKYLQ